MSIYKWFDLHPGLSLSKRISSTDQKKIFLYEAYDKIKFICSKFQDESDAIEMDVKTLLR